MSKGPPAFIKQRFPRITSTHTYAILEVEKTTYDEIAQKLQNAGYDHVFNDTDKGKVIDMNGIALKRKEDEIQLSQEET
jgi:hypothetical protein